MLTWLAIGTLYFPKPSAICGFLFEFGRILYSIGYLKNPNKRVIGAIISDIGLFGAFIISAISVYNAMKYLTPGNDKIYLIE